MFEDKLIDFWICLHCLHLSKKQEWSLICSWLKKSCFLKSMLLPNFTFDVIYTGNKKFIIKIIFWRCLNRYYSMILIQCYYLVSRKRVRNIWENKYFDTGISGQPCLKVPVVFSYESAHKFLLFNFISVNMLCCWRMCVQKKCEYPRHSYKVLFGLTKRETWSNLWKHHFFLYYD